MKHTPGSVEGNHVLLTGPISGNVQLEDGTVVDVSNPFIEVSDDQAEEIAHRISMRYYEEGHPDDVEPDPETGQLVQRPFDYQPPEKFAADLEGVEPAGVPAPEATDIDSKKKG